MGGYANDHGISTSRVFQGCVLEIFGVTYLTYLIPISLGGGCMRSSWYGLAEQVGDMIGCESQRVIFEL